MQILREGLLVRPKSAEQVGYARLASTLRRVAIGFGLERYRTQTESELLAARRAAENLLERDPDFKGDCGSSDLQAVLATIDPLVSLAARAQDSPIALLETARELLASYARAETAIDRYARAKLIGDIDGLLSLLNTSQSTPSNALTNIRAWLGRAAGAQSDLGEYAESRLCSCDSHRTRWRMRKTASVCAGDGRPQVSTQTTGRSHLAGCRASTRVARFRHCGTLDQPSPCGLGSRFVAIAGRAQR